MQRRKDWAQRLNAYIGKVKERPHSWGRFDCCIFVGDAVKAQTGVDPMKEFRRKYRSREGAARVLKEIGSGSLYATVRSKFGNPVPASMGRRGDILYHEGSLGIIMGRFALLLTEDRGLLALPIIALGGSRAFRVPFRG